MTGLTLSVLIGVWVFKDLFGPKEIIRFTHCTVITIIMNIFNIEITITLSLFVFLWVSWLLLRTGMTRFTQWKCQGETRVGRPVDFPNNRVIFFGITGPVVPKLMGVTQMRVAKVFKGCLSQNKIFSWNFIIFFKLTEIVDSIPNLYNKTKI